MTYPYKNWDKDVRSFTERRCAEGAETGAIVTELGVRWPHFKGEWVADQVDALRTENNLPVNPENSMRAALSATSVRGSGRGNDEVLKQGDLTDAQRRSLKKAESAVEVGLSKGRANLTDKRSERIVVPTIKRVEIDPNELVETPFEQSVPIKPFVFKPVAVLSPEEGKTYVVVGIGPARYKGATLIEAGGLSIKTHEFLQAHALSEPVIARFPENKLKEKVRELVSPETIKAALSAIKGDKTAKTEQMPPTDKGRLKILEEVRRSYDLDDAVAKARLVFGGDKTAYRSGAHIHTVGNLLMQNLASEFAIVMETSFERARKIVEIKAGYKDAPEAPSRLAAPKDNGPSF